MAERDTIWFFELSQLDDASVVVTLPGATAETESLTLAQLAAEVRCAGEYVLDGPVRLVFDAAPDQPVTIVARMGRPRMTVRPAWSGQ